MADPTGNDDGNGNSRIAARAQLRLYQGWNDFFLKGLLWVVGTVIVVGIPALMMFVMESYSDRRALRAELTEFRRMLDQNRIDISNLISQPVLDAKSAILLNKVEALGERLAVEIGGVNSRVIEIRTRIDSHISDTRPQEPGSGRRNGH